MLKDFKGAIEAYATIMGLKESLSAKSDALGTELAELEDEVTKPNTQASPDRLAAVQARCGILREELSTYIQDLCIVSGLRRLAMEDIADVVEARANPLTPEELTKLQANRDRVDREKANYGRSDT